MALTFTDRDNTAVFRFVIRGTCSPHEDSNLEEKILNGTKMTSEWDCLSQYPFKEGSVRLVEDAFQQTFHIYQDKLSRSEQDEHQDTQYHKIQKSTN